MERPIDLFLISGFLGAGKTTFLKTLLHGRNTERLGVLVNEFGSLGVDGQTLEQDGLRLVEIKGGSVFCACLKAGFVRTLKAFSAQPVDSLLVEASGMADPAGMAKILDELSPYTTRPYRYRGCVCLVDATTFAAYAEVLPAVQNQVATADLILVNKADLAGEAELAEVHAAVRGLNRVAPVYNTVRALLPPGVLEKELASHGLAAEGSNTPSTRPQSCVLRTEAPLTEARLRAFHTALAGKAQRVKGFIPGPQGRLRVEGVADRLELAPAPAQPQGERDGLVLISVAGGDFEAQVRAAWAASGGGAMRLTVE